MEPILLTLSPKASEFIQHLRSLHYLHPPLDTILFSRLLTISCTDQCIELQEIKRETAKVIFDNKANLPIRVQKYLSKDWNILFG